MHCLRFYLQSADGKAYCGAGKVILDALGVTLKDTSVGFYIDGDANRYGYIAAILTGGVDEDLWITTEHGAKLILNANGVIEPLSNIVPAVDGSVDLGTAPLAFGEIHGELIKAYENLRIPAVNADPAALANGDLWLRTDL